MLGAYCPQEKRKKGLLEALKLARSPRWSLCSVESGVLFCELLRKLVAAL